MTEPAVLLARVRPRWQRAAQVILILVLLATTAVALQVVITTNTALGRTASAVAIGQQRATTLSTAQREALRLLQDLTELGPASDLDAVMLRRGLLERQLTIVVGAFPAGSAERTELADIRFGITAFPWAGLSDPIGFVTVRATAMGLVSEVEVRIKELYDPQESFFYQSTLTSLAENQKSQRALEVLVALVALLCVCWVFTLKRRGRSDMSRAYNALVGQMAERRSAEQALRRSEGRFRSLVQRASDLTAVTDATGAIDYLSPASEQILGSAPDRLTGRSLLDSVHPEDRQRAADMLALLIEEPSGATTLELRVAAPDGRARMVEAVCSNRLADPAVAGIVWNCRDVTDRRALQDQLSHQASHDMLTGLPNRALLLRRLGEAVRQAADTDGSVAAVLLDIDGFKTVNDTLGHAAGDELLQRVAERLRGCILEGDTVARLGGDEFAALLPSCSVAEDAQRLALDVRRALGTPFEVAKTTLEVSASIGVVLLPAHGSDPVTLLQHADVAMYAAKGATAGVCLYSSDDDAANLRRLSLSRELRHGIEAGELVVHYQPKVALGTGELTGVEALVRWDHAKRGRIMPDEFIPVAEQTGLIGLLTQEVLRTALTQVRSWLDAGSRVGVAVNLSARGLLEPGLCRQVAGQLATAGVPAELLTFEITESSLMGDFDHAVEVLHELVGQGISLSLDDFGTGYSSLTYLQRLPVQEVKIDKSFVLSMNTDPTDRAIVRAVIELAHTLGMVVVAEGVEDEATLRGLLGMSCDVMQGYLVSRPLPADQATEWLQNTTGRIPEQIGPPGGARRLRIVG